jgi:hypothetical protein
VIFSIHSTLLPSTCTHQPTSPNSPKHLRWPDRDSRETGPDDPLTDREEIARRWPQVLFMSVGVVVGTLGLRLFEFPRTFRRVVARPLPVPGMLDGLPRRGRMGQRTRRIVRWASCRAPCMSALRSGRSLMYSALSHLALGRAATGVRTRTCRARPRRVRVMKPTRGTLSARKLGRCPWPGSRTRVIMEASGVGD